MRALFLEVSERLGLILLQELVKNHLRLTEVSFAPEGLGGSGFAWQKRRVAELLYYETCNLGQLCDMVNKYAYVMHICVHLGIKFQPPHPP